MQLAHLLPWPLPGVARYALANLIRLVVLELIGMAVSLYTAFGMIVLIIRRLPGKSRSHADTSWMDWVLLFFFAAQVFTGIGIALSSAWDRFGSSAVACPGYGRSYVSSRTPRLWWLFQRSFSFTFCWVS